jgi:hypothetical protein
MNNKTLQKKSKIKAKGTLVKEEVLSSPITTEVNELTSEGLVKPPSIASSAKKIKKKISIETKEAVATIAEMGRNLKKGVLGIKKEEESMKESEVLELKEYYKKTLLKDPKSEQGLSIRSFLENLRDPNLRKARMPEIIETHADISFSDQEVSISGGSFRLARGNWIQIDTGSKERNEILKGVLEELGEPLNQRLSKPSIQPTAFLHYYDSIIEILMSLEGKKAQSIEKKYENQAKLISWLCMAYLEIIEETGQEPVENVQDPSNRPYKSSTGGVCLFKDILLKQTLESTPPEGTPTLTRNDIEKKINSSISSRISTREAAELSCVLAEREIEPFKHKYKRETLFKMRAYLATQFFDHAKVHRAEDSCPEDRLLAQKPRYKTPCVWLVIHRNNQRAEILAVKPTTNVTYWGNPESEKEKYSIVPVLQPDKFWEKINPQVIKDNFLKHQTIITWSVMLFSVATLCLGMFTSLPEGSSSETQVQTASTITNVANETPKEIGKNLEIKEISPNNVGGPYNISVNSPTKKTSLNNKTSMEW